MTAIKHYNQRNDWELQEGQQLPFVKISISFMSLKDHQGKLAQKWFLFTAVTVFGLKSGHFWEIFTTNFWQLWPGFVKGAEIPLVTIFGLRISGSSRVNSATKFSWLLSPWFLALFTVWSMGGVAFYWDLLRDVTNLESDLSQIIYRKYL